MDSVYEFTSLAGVPWFANFDVLFKEVDNCPKYLGGYKVTIDNS